MTVYTGCIQSGSVKRIKKEVVENKHNLYNVICKADVPLTISLSSALHDLRSNSPVTVTCW